MRKASIAFAVLAAALVLSVPAVAMANYAIHGSYTMDTDACAGCHRAHTAASSITWTKSDNTQGSALLISTASENYEFCYTCHDAVGQGADTNVEEGVYMNRAGYTGSGTFGTVGNTLNGGGFDASMFPAQHMYTGGSWGAYGGGTDGVETSQTMTGEGPKIEMSCSACHDVHGSSNYRLLKDVVNGVTVGGYIDDPMAPENPNPDPFVISNETGYPSEGWRLHGAGATQVAGYTPDYTTPRYAKAPSSETTRGISVWCAACHTQYTTTASMYKANDGFPLTTRHRHPVNVPLSNFLGPRSLIVTAQVLPLAHGAADAGTNDASDWIDCLTCHRAHGSDTVMSGYANVENSTDPQPDTGIGGVDPTNSNALLRLDDRGVCEVCHNK